MKTRQQIAEEIHDELEREYVRLEVQVRSTRIYGEAEKTDQFIAERERVETKLALLKDFMDGRP